MAKTVVTGVKGLSQKLKQLGMDVEKNVERAAVAGAVILQNGAKQRVKRVSGNLSRSIHIGGHEDQASDFSTNIEDRGNRRVPKPERSKDRITVYVGTDVVYAAIHEFGGEIRPVRAKVLRFKLKNGEWVVARRVRRNAQPFMRPTFDEDGPEAAREVGEALRDIIRAAVKK